MIAINYGISLAFSPGRYFFCYYSKPDVFTFLLTVHCFARTLQSFYYAVWFSKNLTAPLDTSFCFSLKTQVSAVFITFSHLQTNNMREPRAKVTTWGENISVLLKTPGINKIQSSVV